jgi:ribosomal-protein-serine acetyltransferase
LRILEPRHAQEFLEFVVQNRASLGAWLGWAKSIQSLEDSQKFLTRGITRFAEDSLPWVGIWQDGVLAGGILFFPVEKYVQSTEIGYWLGEDFVGRGIMTRAIRAMLEYCFFELQLNRIGLKAEPENLASRAVAERLGFTFEGIQRQVWRSSLDSNHLVDLASYSMLASEYQKII